MIGAKFRLNEKISVIVPVYNTERYVETCLKSLLKQSYSNLEIIIVDDGSTDHSYEIIEQYARKDPRLILFRTKNEGVASARNLALKAATGAWIAFCDSDDMVPPNAYENMLCTGINFNADVVVGTLQMEQPNGYIYFKFSNKQDSFTKFYHGPSLCNRMFRKSTIEGIEFAPLSAGEDIDFLTAVFERTHKIVSVKQKVYIYKMRKENKEKSLTHSYSIEIFQCYVACWLMARNSWKKFDLSLGERYLAQTTIPYLYRQMLLIPTIPNKCKALELLKPLLLEVNWNKYAQIFKAVFGCTYSELCSFSPFEYFDYIIGQDAKEKVLKQFAEGQIGMLYIMKYFQEWCRVKAEKFFNKKRI